MLLLLCCLTSYFFLSFSCFAHPHKSVCCSSFFYPRFASSRSLSRALSLSACVRAGLKRVLLPLLSLVLPPYSLFVEYGYLHVLVPFLSPFPFSIFLGEGLVCVCVCVVFSRSRRPCEFLFLSVALVLYFSTAVSAGLTFFSFGFAPLCEQKKSWSHKTKKKGKEGVARQR